MSDQALEIIDTGKKPAEENMSLDIKFLDNMKAAGRPCLHLYGWERLSLTYGYFISLDKYLNLKKLKEKAIAAARRPTGGGIVFHFWDLAFSFFLPSGHRFFSEKTIENYRFVNQMVLQSLLPLLPSAKLKDGSGLFLKETQARSFCMAGPSQYDLVLDGKKAAGAAQRKKPQGYLHQGTVALVRPEKALLLELLLDRQLAEKIFEQSFFLEEELLKLEALRAKLKAFLILQFQKTLL
ncbi:MAG: hypothetical protein WC371_02380 [Parachlamydiales bacterium]